MENINKKPPYKNGDVIDAGNGNIKVIVNDRAITLPASTFEKALLEASKKPLNEKRYKRRNIEY